MGSETDAAAYNYPSISSLRFFVSIKGATVEKAHLLKGLRSKPALHVLQA